MIYFSGINSASLLDFGRSSLELGVSVAAESLNSQSPNVGGPILDVISPAIQYALRTEGRFKSRVFEIEEREKNKKNNQ
jgi:hypothetical protein